MLVMMHSGMKLSTVKEYDLRQFPEIFFLLLQIYHKFLRFQNEERMLNAFVARLIYQTQMQMFC